jgi:hypothetical protein
MESAKHPDELDLTEIHASRLAVSAAITYQRGLESTRLDGQASVRLLAVHVNYG